MGWREAVKAPRAIVSLLLLRFHPADHVADGDNQPDKCEDTIGQVALYPDKVSGGVVKVDNEKPDTTGNEQDNPDKW